VLCRPSSLIAAAGLLFACSSVTHAQGVWDANAQFSPSTNPNGVWTYGFKLGRTGFFAPMPFNFDINLVSFWGFSVGTPSIAKNSTNQPRLIADDPVVPAGVMMMHPGQDGGNELEAVLRWTAPGPRVVRIDATFGGIVIDPDPTTVDVSVLLNNTTELFSQELVGIGTSARFLGTRTVAAGEFIDFQVGRGANGTIFDDSTAVRIRVIDCLTIDSQPQSTSVCSNSGAAFAVMAEGAGTLTYRWQVLDGGTWRDLTDGALNLGGIPRCATVLGSGLAGMSLSFSCGDDNILSGTQFRCVVSTSCGTLTSSAAEMSVRRCPCGPADLGSEGGAAGGDGFLDNNDFIVFIGSFFEMNLAADLGSEGGAAGGDGIFDNNDFIIFIQRFFEGC
jgi:hypothetical protein